MTTETWKRLALEVGKLELAASKQPFRLVDVVLATPANDVILRVYDPDTDRFAISRVGLVDTNLAHFVGTCRAAYRKMIHQLAQADIFREPEAKLN